ncbi:MAG: Hsp70 family protein [Candidatus Promineifilaceae bacterium]
MKLGVDFGTTHTTAAVYRDGSVHFVRLDEPQNLLRSMIYITREHDVVLGKQAVERYLDENTGRIVITREKKVGTVENWVARMSRGPLEPDGPIQLIYDVIIDEDISSPGRLIQSIKTGLRQEDYDGTNVFGRYYALEELIALILRHTKESAEAQFGEPITEVAMGRPVKFSDDPEVDAKAQQRLHDAAKMAGFEKISYVPEPLAAARFYTKDIESDQTILIFDFGGGTLDFSILHVSPTGESRVLSTHGVLVGGDDFDSAIMQGKVAEDFGEKARMRPDNTPIPQHLYGFLSNWQTIPLLSRVDSLPIIRRGQEKSDNPEAFKKLESLVMNNYGFPLFEAIERAKRQLSITTDSTITLNEPKLDMTVDLTRIQFQVLISPYLGEVQIGLRTALEKANITAEQVDAVITTGGSSLIPIFQGMLARQFPDAKLVRSDTFGSVGAGLAIAASEMSD